jgi:GTP-binding protein
MKSRKFIDHAHLYAKAGNGGNGCASFRREKFVPRGGPDGGDGGKGGDIILRADGEVDSLIDIYFSPHRRAKHGVSGSGQQKHGRNGPDLYISVPLGTEVWDAQTDVMLCDLIEQEQLFTVAHGGKGGLGNVHWKSSTHQAPREHTDGEKGEEAELRLELKIAADIGLVGFPNAGKSSLLTAISDAHPRIGAYPFTTLNPIIGTVIFEDYTRIKVADIPGLIEGAHDGVGLGHAFLRHVERSAFLLYVIDMAGSDCRKPEEDYACLVNELACHREDLATRPSLVVANKMDYPEAEENLKRFTRKTGITPLPICAPLGEGIDELKQKLYELVNQPYDTDPQDNTESES